MAAQACIVSLRPYKQHARFTAAFDRRPVLGNALVGLLAVVLDDSLADTSPLFRLISRYADANMLAAIANEYRTSLSG